MVPMNPEGGARTASRAPRLKIEVERPAPSVKTEFDHLLSQRKNMLTRMWADAQRDGRPAEYRWRLLRKFRNSIPCTTPQSLAEVRCWSAMQ